LSKARLCDLRHRIFNVQSIVLFLHEPLLNGSQERMRLAETLDARWYKLLLHRAHERTCARTCALWIEGAPTEGLLLLESGTLRLTRKDKCGQQIAVGEESAPAAILTPGLFDGGLNCITARALTDCTVHVVARSSFLTLCQQNPDLLLQVTTALSQRDRRTADFIDLVTVGNVRQRVARLLIDLMRQSGSTRIALPHSQGTLAQSLGTVREVLFRSLKHLQSEGVLRFRGNEIVIENEQALSEAADSVHDADPVFDLHATTPTPRYLALLLRP
jgi:CRP-like cAMP-binding protein